MSLSKRTLQKLFRRLRRSDGRFAADRLKMTRLDQRVAAYQVRFPKRQQPPPFPRQRLMLKVRSGSRRPRLR